MSLEKPLFTTDRLIISIPGKTLAQNAVKFYLANKYEAQRWDPPPGEYFFTKEYQREILERDLNGFADGFETRFWVFLKEETTEPIGYILIQRVIRTDYQASCIVGYFLEKRYWGKGYMTESLRQILEILYTDYKMQRISAYIMPENEPSIGVVKRLGFEYEGVTKSYLYLKGKWTDHLCYSHIRPQMYGSIKP